MLLQDMRIAWEEPFGPVIPVIRVKTIDDAIDHCNSNNLALQVGFVSCNRELLRSNDSGFLSADSFSCHMLSPPAPPRLLCHCTISLASLEGDAITDCP